MMVQPSAQKDSAHKDTAQKDAAQKATAPETLDATPAESAQQTAIREKDAALSAADRTEAVVADETRPEVDVEALARRLLGRWAKERLESRALIKDPAFHRIEGQPRDEHRERTLGQLQKLAEAGAVQRAFPKDFGGEDNHGGNIAAFEELTLADPSLQIKAGVQWGLFGAAVMHLGTREHHEKWLPGIGAFTIPGAFAMTETGHGSDVASIATTAHYDEASEEFVIHTPFRAAWKDYIGNAALHGRAAVVFAQLITKGVNHGVHAFYVPLRDEEGSFLPGIGGEDDGHKGGLNGIDNGRLHFDQVRIPRTNLLNRYGDVAVDGSYTSPIESPGRRFFTMIGTLVQGRVSLTGASVSASKLALTIALRYASERRQFTAGSDTDEEVILDYQRHQRRLIPRLATTYAMGFAHETLLSAFDSVFSGESDTDEDRQDLETLAAALKPLATWQALDILQEGREACGGAGFLAENRFTGLRSDLDIYATFEGDNTVLLQLVAKRLLTDYSRKFAHADMGAIAGYVAEQVGDRVFHRTGLRQLAQSVADFGRTARSVEQLRDTEDQRELLTDRVHTMVAEIAGRLRPASKLPQKEAAELFNRNQNELIEAATAHAELLQWEAFTEALESIEDAGTRTVLTWLRDVYGLGLLEKHLSWYLLNGRLSGQRGHAVTAYLDRLIARLRPHALDLVDAFGLEPEHIRAPIATGAEAERQRGARDYARAQRESGEAPVEEKALRAAEKAAARAAKKR